MMYQFQCEKEGTLFYYQHGSRQAARALITHCPVCWSDRVNATGRIYAEVDEAAKVER